MKFFLCVLAGVAALQQIVHSTSHLEVEPNIDLQQANAARMFWEAPLVQALLLEEAAKREALEQLAKAEIFKAGNTD